LSAVNSLIEKSAIPVVRPPIALERRRCAPTFNAPSGPLRTFA